MFKPKMIAAGAGALTLALAMTAGGLALADDNNSRWPMHAADHPAATGQAVTSMGAVAEMDGFMGQMGAMAEMNVADEFDYLTMMIPHHEEAIAAATILRDGTESPEMRAFAEQIIETQSNELVQIEAWLASWYPERDTAVDYTPMMRDLSDLSGDSLDQAFLEDMIPHHMAAVMMSQQLLSGDLADHEDVEPFARAISDTQRAEIGQMVGWLTDGFGASPMGTHGPIGTD